MMCSKGEFKHYDRLEPKILCGIVQENSRIYEDLRELKIVCQCIGLTFKSINPSVSMEKIVSHLLTQEYMKGCHPIVLQMCEHWIKELSFF